MEILKKFGVCAKSFGYSVVEVDEDEGVRLNPTTFMSPLRLYFLPSVPTALIT